MLNQGTLNTNNITITTKTKPKTKKDIEPTEKDIDAFVLTEAELKESFESVATSCYPEHPMEEIIFRTILSSYHFLHKCLRHGLDTNQKSIVFDENEGCFWDSRFDDDKYFVKDMTLFATKLKSIGLEKNDEIKLYIEKFCSHDDRDVNIEAEYLVPLRVSDNDKDNDGAGAETKKSGRKIDTVNGGGKFDDDDRFKKRIGVKVLVHGLISQSDLNGSIGTFMGRSPKTERKNDEVRYKIKVTVTKETKLLISCPNQIFLLRKDNFYSDDAEITDVSSDAFTHLVMKDLAILELEQHQQRAQAGNQDGITTPTVHVQEAPVRGSKGKKEKKNIEDPGGITTRFIQEPIEQKQPEGPRMIAATFKCPKNKTPGDVIEVVNPHQLGQKIKVTIPKGTKPKKQFRVLVPLPGKKKEILPSCCICTKALPKKDEDTHKIRAPLRVCDHLSCNSCHALIEGKTCPKCSIPVPKHDTFKLLPFVQQLDNSESM